MGTTFETSVTLEKKTCGRCGGVFALNLDFVDNARRTGSGYHCPYCDTRWSWNESESDKLRKELEIKERELRESKCETLRQKQLLEEESKKLLKLAKRIRNGVCPCCHRSFANIKRHMEMKHPESLPVTPHD